MKEKRGRTVMRKMEEDVSYRSLVWFGNTGCLLCVPACDSWPSLLKDFHICNFFLHSMISF